MKFQHSNITVKKHKIILVEDDLNLGFLTQEYLESEGYDVKLYRDGEAGYNGFKNGNFDMCILDVMLPKMDGFSLAQKIKDIKEDIPIIFLTAKSLKEDKLKGFRLGADDYITKPFDEEELLYRIKAVLMRINVTREKTIPEFYAIGKYKFVPSKQRIYFNDNEERLASRESELLKILCKSINSIVSKDDILNEIWGENDYFKGRSLDVFVSKLRKYLKDDPNVAIESIPKSGIMLIVSENH